MYGWGMCFECRGRRKGGELWRAEEIVGMVERGNDGVGVVNLLVALSISKLALLMIVT
jgi:hypothetical protein